MGDLKGQTPTPIDRNFYMINNVGQTLEFTKITAIGNAMGPTHTLNITTAWLIISSLVSRAWVQAEQPKHSWWFIRRTQGCALWDLLEDEFSSRLITTNPEKKQVKNYFNRDRQTKKFHRITRKLKLRNWMVMLFSLRGAISGQN